MTVTTDESGKSNVWAKEPTVYTAPQDVLETQGERAEKLNGRIAMISLMLAFASYASTGTIAWGLF